MYGSRRCLKQKIVTHTTGVISVEKKPYTDDVHHVTRRFAKTILLCIIFQGGSAFLLL